MTRTFGVTPVSSCRVIAILIRKHPIQYQVLLATLVHVLVEGASGCKAHNSRHAFNGRMIIVAFQAQALHAIYRRILPFQIMRIHAGALRKISIEFHGCHYGPIPIPVLPAIISAYTNRLIFRYWISRTHKALVTATVLRFHRHVEPEPTNLFKPGLSVLLA